MNLLSWVWIPYLQTKPIFEFWLGLTKQIPQHEQLFDLPKQALTNQKYQEFPKKLVKKSIYTKYRWKCRKVNKPAFLHHLSLRWWPILKISMKFHNFFILVWNKEVQRNPYPKHNHYVTLIKSKNNYLLPRAKKLCN